MGDLRTISMLESSLMLDDNNIAALQLDDSEEYANEQRYRTGGLLATLTSTTNSVLDFTEDDFDKMLSAEYLGNIFDVVASTHTESSDMHKGAVFDVKSHGAILLMNASLNSTESSFVPELFYRHSMAMTVVYCVAYFIVFAVGIVGNFCVIAVVFRSPRMRTVTNFFIVNLAVADILVIVFCLPATLMSNIFVRKYIIISFTSFWFI